MTTLPVMHVAVARGLSATSTVPEVSETTEMPATVTRMETAATPEQSPRKPVEISTSVVVTEEQASEMQTAASPSAAATPQGESPAGYDQSPQRGTSPRQTKKRRVARQGAEQIAPVLREKTKQIGEQLSGKTSDRTNHYHPSASVLSVLDNVSESLPLNPEQSAKLRDDCDDRMVLVYPAEESVTTSTRPPPTSWADDTESNGEVDSMDTSETVTAITSVSKDDDVNEKDNASTKTTAPKQRATDPFSNGEYF
ncbi:integumentary mucin A.1-like [Schistocerca cancellata]|uniref:integumentary mucin A.1-like n=1 Tax=Schistocerca cancellata TaxID=274614 RepID=UPI002118A55E|nr:integumentary mucin A.1-like [Schistocerca cancellata]